jgi:hypothetical protein
MRVDSNLKALKELEQRFFEANPTMTPAYHSIEEVTTAEMIVRRQGIFLVGRGISLSDQYRQDP